MDKAKTRARLAALERVAGARRDADLAKLAAVSARLAHATGARDALSAALAREVEGVLQAPEVPTLRALDAHILLAERARAALEARIAILAAEREVHRRATALSFGRADVLGQMRDRLRPAPRT